MSIQFPHIRMDLSILATITGLSSILINVAARHARFMDFSKYATPLLCLTSGSPFVWANVVAGFYSSPL